MKNKIIIAGGSGALGTALLKNFHSESHEVVILSRKKGIDKGNVRYVVWDGKSFGAWVSEIDGADVVINLTGKYVNCRYTPENRKEIIDSRVDSTTILAQAINKVQNPPSVWINAGSAAIFGDGGDEVKYENSPAGNGFSPDVCKEWEKAFFGIETPGTRKIFLRIGMVLQQDSGVLKPLINIVRLGFGGKIGNGKQFITWIHEEDFLRVINWVIAKEGISGIIHCASPNPVSNASLMKSLRKALHIPFGFPTPAFLVKIGTAIIGSEPELVLTGRRVKPGILLNSDFTFKYPFIDGALNNLFSK
jgi:uncharacterized protein